MNYQKIRSVFDYAQKSGFLTFSKTELKVISELGNGNRTITDIARALNISASQVYRIAQKLEEKGILNLSRGVLHPEMKTHISMLLKLLSKARNLSSPLSGTGLQIFMALIEPKTIKEVETKTGLHKTTVLKKINQGRKMSLILIENKKYRLNEKIWFDAKECLTELKAYENVIDQRVPINSEIYFKSNEEIVFSNKDTVDATKTAFSMYGEYGIKLFLITNYYYLPKKNVSKEEVLRHSIYVVEKSKDTRELIFVAIFYAKYHKELQHIKHVTLDNLNKIFNGEKIPDYPSLQEIKDRAKIYNIEVPK
jgi:DNA-binding Lrp family transcriptional regulator